MRKGGRDMRSKGHHTAMLLNWGSPFGTAPILYSDGQGGWLGRKNTDSDPQFAELGRWVDVDDPREVVRPDSSDAVWVSGDYHLRSEAGRWVPWALSWAADDVTSPCFDASDPGEPVGEEPQPNGSGINMGAYGGTAEAGKSP